MQDTLEPPEEYYRILNQFHAWRDWSPIHEPQLEQNGPSTNSHDSDSMPENAMLEAETRRHSPDPQDLISPFRAPNIFDYQDTTSITTSARPDPNDYFIISGYLNFDSSIGREDVERYLAFEPSIQNRDFEQELEDILIENHTIVARHQGLAGQLQLLTSFGHQNTSVVYRVCLIQVLAEMREAVMTASEVHERFMKIRGIQLCRQVLRGEISRVEAHRQYDLHSAYSQTLHDYWVEVDLTHRSAERLDYFSPLSGSQEHEVLTALPDTDAHMADRTVIMPIGYTLTREDFLEEVVERSPDAHTWDFQERLRHLRADEREAIARYQRLLAEQQSIVQHGYHNTSVLYRYRYIWICEEIWEAVDNSQEAWNKFVELQDLELREGLLTGEITLEQIERIRNETQYRGDTLEIRWMQAWIAYIEAKRLVGFNAVTRDEVTHANTNFFTSIMAFLTRLHRIIMGALGL